MVKRYRLITCMLIIFLFLTNIVPCKVFGKEKLKKQVLFLNSYHKGYGWSDSITRGIEKEFETCSRNIDLFIEYMDMRRVKEAEYLDNLYELYKVKYKKHRFDAIIVSDNDAFLFILKYGEKLFPNIPIVFCGINGFNELNIKNYNTSTGITGITEDPDIKDTLDLALTLHPNTKRIIVMAGKNITDNINKDIIENIIPYYRERVDFSIIEEEKICDVRKELAAITDESIIFFMADFIDPNGNYISPKDSIRIISRLSKFPIYTSWNYLLDTGVVGGKVTDGETQGGTAARMVLKIVNGVDINNIQIEYQFKQQQMKTCPLLNTKNQGNNEFFCAYKYDIQNKYVFDYNELKKHNIDLSKLPDQNIILNEPIVSLTISRENAIAIVSIIIISLIIIILILLRNILKRRDAEKALKESEERLRTLINTTPDIVCFKDSQGRWLEGNEAIQKVFNLIDKEYIGKTDLEIAEMDSFYRESHIRCHITDEITWKKGDISREEETICKKNGHNLIFDIIKVPLYHKNGKRKGMVIFGRDITERKKLIEAKQYDKFKTEFFANISHELKTPLNVMLSTIQLLELYLSNDILLDKSNKIEKRIYNLKQNGYRLLRLVNNLIDITKIDSGFLDLNLGNYNIVNIVEDISLSVADYVENKGLNLLFDTTVEEKIIACDAAKIERIILNLLSNAVKFTKSGGKIMVNIKDEGEWVNISVKDTGIGIPKDKLEVIFERFRQVDKSFQRAREGSGIGLSLVKSLIEMHGGNILVKSEIGIGSEFVVKLPVKTTKIEELKKIDNNNYYYEGIDLEFSDIYN